MIYTDMMGQNCTIFERHRVGRFVFLTDLGFLCLPKEIDTFKKIIRFTYRIFTIFSKFKITNLNFPLENNM